MDFTEPPGGDPIAVQDDEDRYFDDQEPSDTPITPNMNIPQQNRLPGTHTNDESVVKVDTQSELSTQNGQGEYDY